MSNKRVLPSLIESHYQSFSDMTTHELKSPLTTIKIFNEILINRSQKEQNKFFTNYLKKIDSEINSLTDLINNYYQIEKIQNRQIKFHLQNLNLQKLIPSTLSKIKDDLKIKFKIKGNYRGQINIDPQHFQQLLSLLAVQQLSTLSPQNNNLIFSFTTKPSGFLLVNIFNPPQTIKSSDLVEIEPIPEHSRQFLNDINSSLANQIALYLQGFVQLYKHPQLEFIFVIRLPLSK